MNDIYTLENFIQDNSPDGGFLQSEEWRKFQESTRKRTFHVELKSPSSPPFEKGEYICFWANIIEHQLPIVGKYFYVPRGPVCHLERIPPWREKSKDLIKNKLDSSASLGMTNIINLAKENNIGWVRVEPENEEILDVIRKNITLKNYKIVKAPHDMQPKEILVMDITKPEEELLSGMKQKTRYNIKLAQKHKVSVKVISGLDCHPGLDPGSRKLNSGSGDGMTNRYIEEFIRLVKIMAKRDRITAHPENYYRKMFETIPKDILKLYVAEYNGKVIATNIIIHYSETATYLHGASDNKYRNLMAPYLLQWQAVKDAKAAGYTNYDLGGIHTKTGEGITRFKLGFAPNIKPIEFPGSWDIVINSTKYKLYKIMQKIKSIL